MRKLHSLLTICVLACSSITHVQANPFQDFYDTMRKNAQSYTFENDKKEDFLDHLKAQLPETAQEQFFYYGPDIVDALVELYAIGNMGTEDVEKVKQTAVMSALAHFIGVINQFRTKHENWNDYKNVPKYVRTIANGYMMYNDFKKLRDAQAVANKNKKSSDCIGAEKSKYFVATILANCLLTYGAHNFLASRKAFNFDGLELKRETVVKEWERPGTVALAALVVGDVLKYLSKYCRYKTELSDLENFTVSDPIS